MSPWSVDLATLAARARRGWPLLLALGGLAYFTWHGIQGERGLRAWLVVSRELEQARADHARLEERRQALERRVDALQPDRSDPDLLEEQLRRLGYVGERELVILAPPAPVR